jgi:hypothetical protein
MALDLNNQYNPNGMQFQALPGQFQAPDQNDPFAYVQQQFPNAGPPQQGFPQGQNQFGQNFNPLPQPVSLEQMQLGQLPPPYVSPPGYGLGPLVGQQGSSGNQGGAGPANEGDPFAGMDIDALTAGNPVGRGRRGINANRAALLGLQQQQLANPKLSKKVGRADYDPFKISDKSDKLMFGNTKAERIAAVKANPNYGNMSDHQVAQILSLGAPKRNFALKNRISQEDKNALKTVATRHYVHVEPDLNALPTANMYLERKRHEASQIKDPTSRANALEKWTNMVPTMMDLDGKPETVDNLVIHDRRDPKDVYGIDGLRLIDRRNAMVKRGIYEAFPDRDERAQSKEFIDRIYKKCLKAYLKPEDRTKHPFNQEMAQKIADKTVQDTPLKDKILDVVRAGLDVLGFTIKDLQTGLVKIAPTRYWSVVSKTGSDFMRTWVYPQLVGMSGAWAQYVGDQYDFVADPDKLLEK